MYANRPNTERLATYSSNDLLGTEVSESDTEKSRSNTSWIWRSSAELAAYPSLSGSRFVSGADMGTSTSLGSDGGLLSELGWVLALESGRALSFESEGTLSVESEGPLWLGFA